MLCCIDCAVIVLCCIKTVLSFVMCCIKTVLSFVLYINTLTLSIMISAA